MLNRSSSICFNEHLIYSIYNIIYYIIYVKEHNDLCRAIGFKCVSKITLHGFDTLNPEQDSFVTGSGDGFGTKHQQGIT